MTELPGTLDCLWIPEHSTGLLTALGGGSHFTIDGFLFCHDADWLTAVGYPRSGSYDASAFEAAIKKAVLRTGAIDVFAIAPYFPDRRAGSVLVEDRYYVLPSSAPVPSRLRSPIAKARSVLRVDETKVFSAGHRRLWNEFMTGRPMSPRIRRLYAITEKAMHGDADLRLLNAWTDQGALAACLVLDYSLPSCVSYVIGAHSRTNYAPHASDLLFAEMLERSRNEGKSMVLLGLGVNDGIRRFKLKWGARPSLPYMLAGWTEQAGSARRAVDGFARALLAAPAGLSKRQIFAMLPEQRPNAMLWRLERGGRVSWIGGSAHFFCCSFEHHLRRLLANVDTVLCEGPLDPESLAEEQRYGHMPAPGSPRVGDFLDESEIRDIERTVRGPQGRLARLLNIASAKPADVRDLLFNARPWFAFFGLWTAFLERHGWNQSVDLEVWNTALDMGKSVMGMESMEEQLASLDSVPMARILRFVRSHKEWPACMRRNRRAYLAGDLDAMMGTTAEFPTRTEQIIGRRDQRFRERMLPYVERGGTAVFVGSAHMRNLRHMLADKGFTVTRELPTISHKLRAFFFQDTTVVLPGNADVISGDACVRRSESIPQPMAHGAGGIAGNTALADLRHLSQTALIAEQLTEYVAAVSDVALHSYGTFAGWSTEHSVVILAFPVNGYAQEMDDPGYAVRIAEAVAAARADPQVRKLTVLTPVLAGLPERSAVVVEDAWWGLALPHVPDAKLRTMIRRAARDITIRQDAWTDAHAALVDEYLRTRALSPGTRSIFSHIGSYLEVASASRLFSAYTGSGTLAGFCVGDFSALSTAFYMFAFRTRTAPPGTSDALLASLVNEADNRGYSLVNLGLGIDDGIGFFKKKWGATTLFPHYEVNIAL